jgi:hypothetical protein
MVGPEAIIPEVMLIHLFPIFALIKLERRVEDLLKKIINSKHITQNTGRHY